MRKSIIYGALIGVLLVFTNPGVAFAGGGGKGCSNIGTWFGIEAPDDMRLTGWVASALGKSNNKGTNIFEFPDFDPTLGSKEWPFVDAVRLGTMRGNWKRTGGNTFDYTFMGFAYGALNETVYIGKVSGQVTLFNRCQYQYTTAFMEVYLPSMNPFYDQPINDQPFSLGEFYGYRAKVDLPY